MSLIMVSCKKKENPSPELMDPIYLDLIKVHKTKAKELEEEQKSTKTLLTDLKSTFPRSPQRKSAQKALSVNRKKIRQMKQKVKYLDIRKKHRRIIARRDYRRAFYNHKVWPDPKDYASYQTNKRLKSVNMNWQSRVPKLFKNNPNFKKK